MGPMFCARNTSTRFRWWHIDHILFLIRGWPTAILIRGCIIAARGKGRKNKATRDASAAPDNPVIAETSKGQRHGDGATSQRMETTRDDMLFQPSEVCSETLPESGTAPTTQASSPMWVNYPELGGNTPPSRTSPGIKEEAQAAIPEDGSVASMLSTPS